MQDFIPSKDVRAYMQRTGFTFSDRDLASVIFQSDLPLAQRHEALEQLAQRSADSELCRQIGERIAYDRRATERFAENDGRFLYQLLLAEEGVPAGFFSQAAAAREAGLEKTRPFSIHKYRFQDTAFPAEEAPTAAAGHGLLAGMVYKADGTLSSCWSYEISPEEEALVKGPQRFEERFVALPNPFQRGDIVRLVEDPGTLGVVESSREDWDELVEAARAGSKKLDCFDATLQVEILNDDGTFGHDHISPLGLEWVTGKPHDEKTALLAYASALLTGHISLDFFLEEYRDYGKGL